jgi:predicted MFS family arabinose efflux permease
LTISDVVKSPFVGLPRELWLLAGAALINFLGYMVLPFLALYLTAAVGLSVQVAGVLLTVHGVGTVIGAWLGGTLSDQFSPRNVLLASFCLTACFMGVFPLVLAQELMLGALLLVLGLSQGLFRPAYDAYVLNICPESDRGRAYAVYVVAINLGAAIGTFVGGLAFTIYPAAIFWIDGAASVLAAIWLLGALPVTSRCEHPVSHSENADASSTSSYNLAPWRNFFFLSTCAFVMIIEAIGKQQSSTLPLYMTSAYNISPQEFGQILTIGHILFAVLVLPVTTWVRSKDPYILAALGALILGLGFALLPVSETKLTAILLYSVVLFGQVLFYPAVIRVVMDLSAQTITRRGGYMGFYRSGQSLAGIMAPALGTWLYMSASPATLWVLCGIGGLAAAFFFAVTKIGKNR